MVYCRIIFLAVTPYGKYNVSTDGKELRTDRIMRVFERMISCVRPSTGLEKERKQHKD